MQRATTLFVVGAALLACASSSRSKNDEIAACNASGGRWVDGGCNAAGHCERPGSQAAPSDGALDPTPASAEDLDRGDDPGDELEGGAES